MNVHSENRGRPRTDDKRAKILLAALEAFAARGYHGVAVPEVARAAGVGVGTVYRYFADKQDLVNAVYTDAKGRLGAVIAGALVGAAERAPRDVFRGLWAALVGFVRAEPVAFRFLELQDHLPYLTEDSRRLEAAILMPLWLEGTRVASGPLPVEVRIALVWGALVGLVRAETHGYLALDDAALARAGDACWAAFHHHQE
ncbi:MAG: TetR/AcrR family transcriptional regulator [Myxococcota bacterium]